MTEFLSKTVSKRKILNPGETLEVAFNVQNPGNVFAYTAALGNGLFPFKQVKLQLELQFGGVSPRTIRKSEDEYAIVTSIGTPSNESRFGIWKARVTNKDKIAHNFALNVTYPGTIKIETKKLYLKILNPIFESTVKKINIHLTNGNNKSYIEFPSSMDVPKSTFTIPNFQVRTPVLRVIERVNDINSKSVVANLENANADKINGSFKFDIEFETSGHEIVGTIHANLSNMKLSMRLGIAVENGKITYLTDNMDVDFPIAIDLVNIPDFLENIANRIVGFRNTIREKVKAYVRKAFASPKVKTAITSKLNSQIANVVGNDAKIVSAKVENGVLIIKYYNT